MCVRMGPHGIPLDETTLDDMPMEKRNYFLSFMELAKKELDRANWTPPIKPSVALQEMFTKIVNDYDGRIYCQVNQVEGLFSFA
ncbi:MAG: hypothetical protein LiPW15_686 [Parcubacteria group bacterium LiPW_15]|nr:MAG: hypothetical protein LiPW15_686 [Parcubacteria group bacterium LiPW_15]